MPSLTSRPTDYFVPVFARLASPTRPAGPTFGRGGPWLLLTVCSARSARHRAQHLGQDCGIEPFLDKRVNSLLASISSSAIARSKLAARPQHPT